MVHGHILGGITLMQELGTEYVNYDDVILSTYLKIVIILLHLHPILCLIVYILHILCPV